MSSRRIGSYQITEYVGGGGFGSVFKAEDVNTPGRIVAVKELHKKHTRNQVIKQRFFQEAVAMARLDHPNLPRLYTFGEDNGCYYLVMEFISGKLLSDELHEKGPMPPDRAVTVLTQVLDAVSYAHRNGIIHRDLKPDNIIIVGGTGAVMIKVLDFGIARMVGGENLTLAGEGFGTPSYMAPERMTGAAGDDPRMDLYSAGIILYEMLAGKAPFESKATDPALYWVEMRDLHSREPLPSMSSLNIPTEVERVALRATAKRLEDRYQSADEMLGDLRSISGSSSDAPTVVLSSSQLFLTTTPGGAEVYVDDSLRGTSDARGKLLVDGLTAGLHSVRVLKEGFNEYRINVALEEGRQTSLQVAIPARATVAMPAAENTAAGGLDTLRFQGADEIKTAVLVVESLPAGSTLFVGTQAVAHAGEDGRATVSLKPGAHEIRATAPSGATATRIVSVAPQDTGALKTLALPLTQVTSAGSLAPGRPEQSRRGKQLAAAAVVILLLALATAAYFVLRGPDRTQGDPASNSAAAVANPPSAPESSSATPPNDQQAAPQISEDKKKTAEARQQDAAAAAEAQKKANETATKSETKPSPPAQPEPSPAVPTPPPASESAPPAAGRDGCVLVTVLDADGQPVSGVRVGLADKSESNRISGRTGPKGHWLQCGLTQGATVRVAVWGPRGGMMDSQSAVVGPRTFVTFRAPKRLDNAPRQDGAPQRMPGPFRRRP